MMMTTPPTTSMPLPPAAARVAVDADLPAGTHVDVLVETLAPDGQVLAVQSINVTPQARNPLFKKLFQSPPIWKALPAAHPGWLLAIALGLYLITRFIGLSDYPIYFFTDEAIQTVQARSLLNNGMRSEGELLPTFVQNGGQYNLGISVYLQIIPALLFKHNSVVVTRGVSVLVTLLAVLSSALALKNVFNIRPYWLGVGLLTITPAWFLHSRTAFETVIAVSFYSAFLYFYWLYRVRSARYLLLAAFFGALAFYSYSPAQMVILLTAVFLLFSDLTYHWQQRKIVLITLAFIILLAIPYIRFLILHPDENKNHLQILNSYWVQDMAWMRKLGIFLQQYLRGLNPLYWYFPNTVDLARHTMKDYGHMLWITLPFMAAGLVICLRNLRNAVYRGLLLALLAAPAGAALVEVGVTRALFLVIPACLITAIGVNAFIQLLSRLRISQAAGALLTFTIICFGSLFMLRDALYNGPIWNKDYGLNGMQYGGRQLFTAVQAYMAAHPQDQVMVSAIWANGTDTVADFFFDGQRSIELGSMGAYIFSRRPLDENRVLVITPEEYQQVLQETKFTNLRVLETLPYPDGRPGFYFIKLQYAENADEIFAAEAERRRILLNTELILKDEPVLVEYSALDMGEIQNAFDGDANTLIRTLEANPLRIILYFQSAQSLQEISVRMGGTQSRLAVTLTPADQSAPLGYAQEYKETPEPHWETLTFPAMRVSQLQIDLYNVYDEEPAHVHLWEVILK